MKLTPTHRKIAERALGKPLPLHAEVHHVNGNPKDNRSSNLVICQDRAYHRLLHARARARGWKAQRGGTDYILRGVDVAVWRQIKSRAALEGITVKMWLIRLIRAALDGPGVLLVVACLVAMPVCAQEPPSLGASLSAYSFVVAGNAADLWTTREAFSRGAVEGNGLVHGQRIVKLTVTKCAFTGAVLLLMRHLEQHGHPTAARVLGYVDGGVTFSAAAWNHTRMR